MPHSSPEKRREYKRLYREKNREKLRAYFREYGKKHKDKLREQYREWVKKNPDKVKTSYDKYYLKTQYKIIPEEYARILDEQGGRCASCGRTKNVFKARFCVDHDHETGKIRGLLCHNCNIGIGNLGDTIEGVRKALAYLERVAPPQSS